ncbi:MAG: SPOR domain-containing protein [Mangrovibacterium sp.]
MKLPIVVVLLMLFTMSVLAQETSYKPSSTSPGKSLLDRLDLEQDSRVDSLVLNHIRQNKRKEGGEGFRLEIFFSSGVSARENAVKVRTEFLRSFPDVPAYMSFQSPNFKVRVGDLRSKSDALQLKERIKQRYPNAFLVQDQIQFPKLYTDSNKR